jgi:hypothetical protein
MVEAPLAGSIPLEERSEILKAYRARWDNLRWTQVTRLWSIGARCPQFAGKTLVYADIRRPIICYHRLPFGEAPASRWEDYQLVVGRQGTIKAFSPHFGTNLLAAVMEERIENAQ